VTKFILLGLSILNPLVVGVYFQNKRVWIAPIYSHFFSNFST
jgi:hypothetical protein